MFVGYGSSMLKVINNTFGVCDLPYEPLEDCNITLMILFDDDRMQVSSSLPTFKFTFKRSVFEANHGYKLRNNSYIKKLEKNVANTSSSVVGFSDWTQIQPKLKQLYHILE